MNQGTLMFYVNKLIQCSNEPLPYIITPLFIVNVIASISLPWGKT